MIEARGLSKRFGTLTVLDSVDLTIAPGRVTALVGPNGAGKTTLLKIVLGLTRPDSGVITFDGEPLGADERYRARIGYMPQTPRFPHNLTGSELYRMVRELRGVGSPTDERLLEPLRLDGAVDKPVRTLSGGMRQKLNAALAFAFSPDLLILDEPTAGLDPISSALLKDRIVAERGLGRTVIVTSHVMSDLDELADDIVFLEGGHVRFAGPIWHLKRLTNQINLERAVAELMRRGRAA
jgi:Cu-processing system ATP-binding protein